METQSSLLSESRIESFEELHTELATLANDRRWVYRGQRDATWSLTPSVGRPDCPSDISDVAFLCKWRDRALAFASPRAQDRWDWLAIAQHHGLPTRLLDWSYNPLAAAFFAVEESSVADAALFCLLAPSIVEEQRADPYDRIWRGVRVFRPRALTARLTHQRGVFTIHQPPRLSLEDALDQNEMVNGTRLRKIVIPGALRRHFRLTLQRYGVDRAALFGDLDGLSVQMAWEMRNLDAWVDPYVGTDLGSDRGVPEQLKLTDVSQLNTPRRVKSNGRPKVSSEKHRNNSKKRALENGRT